MSLNDKLLKGPDLMNLLVGVLMRLRIDRYAMVGDIEQIFMQMKVSRSHSDFMRVLWWSDGKERSSEEPDCYRLTSHTFGAVSSPSIANFAVKQAVEINLSTLSPGSIRALERGAYVDDIMTSVEDESEAVKVLSQVRSALATLGFNLKGILSNSRAVLESVPQNIRANKCSYVLGCAV